VCEATRTVIEILRRFSFTFDRSLFSKIVTVCRGACLCRRSPATVTLWLTTYPKNAEGLWSQLQKAQAKRWRGESRFYSSPRSDSSRSKHKMFMKQKNMLLLSPIHFLVGHLGDVPCVRERMNYFGAITLDCRRSTKSQ
jgi:hypothetical protein